MLMRRDQLLAWVKPVRQARSLETLERVLDAAEALILERGVHAASVAAVVKRARSSVGAFYARFPDKGALLRAVCQRFVEQAMATAEAALQPALWDEVPLEDVLDTVLQFMQQMAREKRALIACLVTQASEDLVVAEAMDLLVERLGALLQQFLETRGELPEASHPERLVQMLASVLVNGVLAGSLRHPQRPPRWDDSVAGEELTRLCIGYLRVAPAPARRGLTPERRGV